jgi:glycosyltransferase involved in cell wall biosynthesis
MKILVTFPGDRLTGAGRYAAAICRELISRKHVVTVAIHGDGPATKLFLADSSRRPLVRRVDMPPLRRSVRAALEHASGVFTATSRLARLVAELRPDVMLGHCIFNVWSAAAATRTAVPLVALVHELPSAFPAPLYRTWDFLLARAASRVIVSSEEMRAGLRACVEKAVVISPGIDVADFRPDVDGRPTREELVGHRKGPLVMCVSHIMEGKGQRELVEALPLVFAKLPHARAVFVGGTNDVPKNEAYRTALVSRLRELGIAEQVDLVGERTDIPALLAAADVVVYPSRSESFGLVPVEASAVGTPVVMSDVGVARRLAAQRPGIEVVATTPGELADAILRSSARSRSTTPIGREWTVERCADEIEATLQAFSDGPRAPAGASDARVELRGSQSSA